MSAVDKRGLHATIPIPVEVGIVLPTFNEAANIETTIAALAAALEGVAWEIIIVDDDSSDGTWRLTQEISRFDPRIRCLRRVGRRGLASAAIEGMLASSAPFLAVMDADGQHDESKLSSMLEILRSTDAEIVVGSRYIEGGAASGLADRNRVALSRWGTWVSQKMLAAGLSDPMSGFFMLRRTLLERSVYSLSAVGFKILLDIVMSATPRPRIAEVPFVFRQRFAGDSKLTPKVALEFLLLLADKLFGGRIPVHFYKFVLVGALGAIVHMGVLGLLYATGTLSFNLSQTVATFAAMTFNFFLNNSFTYASMKLTGLPMLRGLTNWYLACSIGAMINLALSTELFSYSVPWLLAGFIGSAVAAVWNFAVTKSVNWSAAATAHHS